MNHTQPPAPETAEAPRSDPLGRHLAGLPRRTLAIALWLLPIVALANIAVLVWSLGTVDLSERLVAPHFLALAALLVMVPMLANAVRLALWSRFLGLPIGFGGALRVITGTMIANSVSPSATGGMPIKVLFLLGEGIELRRAMSLISFQTAEDAITLFALVALTGTISGFAMIDFLGSDPGLAANLDRTVQLATKVAGGLLVGLAVLGGMVRAGILGSRIQAWTDRRLRQVGSFAVMIGHDWRTLLRAGKGLALVNLAIASVQWTVRFSIAGLVLAAFGTQWQPALFWLLQYLVQTISSTVPSPGGVGGAEAGFLLMFSPFVERIVLLPAMSTWRLLFFYLPLAAAAVIFSVLRRRKRRDVGQRQGEATAMGAQLPAE